MSIDDEIHKEKEHHMKAAEDMLAAEKRLENLYTERKLADELYRRLKQDQVDIQISQQDTQHEVQLRKGMVIVRCVASTLSSALLGAHTALQGELAAHAV